jgi:uncharacterized membrane-anchored protein YjiN (DUF445 family)
MQDKRDQLLRAKRFALLCLTVAASVFVASTVVQSYFPEIANAHWLGLIKMASEAALVGGLADWFAVTALFKPIPARYPIPHTNIVASNKNIIAENLSQFVKEKFFHPEAIEQLISSSNPARGAGRWLSHEQNAKRLSRFVCDALVGILRVLDDKPVKAFIGRTAQRGLRQLDLRKLIATSLGAITRDRQHQVVLDRLLGKLAATLAEPETQYYIADTLVLWLKTEHNRIEKLLPSTWLSEQGALIAVRAVSSILDDIYEDSEHPLRHSFDEHVHDFIYELEHSPLMEARIDAYREQIIDDPALNAYLQGTWEKLQSWLLKSLSEKEGTADNKVAGWFHELGMTLSKDSDLASAFNQHIGEAGKYMAPELADFLTAHIRETIKGWDEKEMAEQIELNIGRDLQKVRVNGTIVGGFIGAILYGVEIAILG